MLSTAVSRDLHGGKDGVATGRTGWCMFGDCKAKGSVWYTGESIRSQELLGQRVGEGGMLAPGSRKGNVCRADCCPLQKRLGLGKGVGIEDPS